MNKLKVGIIGCSDFAKRAMVPATFKHEKIDLHAVSSRSIEKAKEWAQIFNCKAYSSYDHIIADREINAVYIPLPSGLQFEWVIKAIESGKHVLVEKTCVGNLNRTKEICRLAEIKKVTVLENFQFLRHRQLTKIEDLINQGKIGDIRLLRSSFCFPPLNKGNFRYKKELGGGALLDAGTYTLKVCKHFLSSSEVVYSNLQFCNETGVDITGYALMKDNNNIPSQLYFGFSSFYQCNLEILGTKGKISADRIFTAPPGFKAKVSFKSGSEFFDYEFTDDHFLNQWNCFYNLIKSSSYLKPLNSMLDHATAIENFRNQSKKNAI